MNITADEQRNRIIEQRQARGLTQRDVARISSISQPSIARIEKGEKAATAPELAAISYAIGATIGHLTGEGSVRDGIRFAARARTDANIAADLEAITHLMEMDAELDRMLL